MGKLSISQVNKYLRNKENYEKQAIKSVIVSSKIEGVKIKEEQLMPTYVYKCVNDDCQDSGVEFERMRLMSQADDELLCEICNKPVERKIVVKNIHKTLWRDTPV